MSVTSSNHVVLADGWFRRGIPLPEFPEPTHGPKGPKPFVTVQQALSSLSRRPYVSHNQVPHHCKVFEVPRPPYDPRTKVLGCITTSGGDDNCHPTGRRTFTIRELAALMSFPPDFKFPNLAVPDSKNGVCKGEVIKQIGNSIPPAVWTLFIQSVINTLRAFDNGAIDADGRKVNRSSTATPASRQPEIISLDSDEEREVAPGRDARDLSRTVRRMSVSVSRASSRTLSPEPAPDPRPSKRPRTSLAVNIDVVDLTGL